MAAIPNRQSLALVVMLCIAPASSGRATFAWSSQLDPLIQLVAASVPLPQTVANEAAPASEIMKHLRRLQALAKVRLAALPEHERLVAFGANLVVIGVADGGRAEVVLGREFDGPLHQASEGIVLVHNHPTGASLSRADFGQLAKVGVHGIVAIGHDGSVYGAVAGTRFDRARFESVIYPFAHEEVMREVTLRQRDLGGNARSLDLLVEHLVATALHKAGVLRYQGLLGSSRSAAAARCVPVCGNAVEAVAARVNKLVRVR